MEHRTDYGVELMVNSQVLMNDVIRFKFTALSGSFPILNCP